MADDKLDFFSSPAMRPPVDATFKPLEGSLTFQPAGNAVPIVIMKPDGRKLRGSDEKPLTELPPEELLAVIDELCRAMAGRR